MTSRISGILLDLGETILHFGRVDIPKLFEAGSGLAYGYLKDLGLVVPEFMKYHRRKLRAIRWSYFKSRITGREFNALDVLERINRRIGITLTPQQTIELAALWYQPLSQCATVEQESIPTLEALRAGGLKLGVISNTFIPAEVLDRHLQREGLLDLLPYRVYSCQIGYRKPHPRIFQTALDLAGLNPAETIFVGDSPKADVGGARRMGMISVLKAPLGLHAGCKIEPDHRIEHLHELPGIIAKYNS